MLYLLAIILPPVAVLACGKPGQAVLNIFLTLLAYFPGLIHALLVVNNYYNDKRTDRIVSVIQPESVSEKKKITIPWAWIVLGVILFAAFIGVCENKAVEARIGETPEECQKRYGDVLKFDKDSNLTIFKKSGFFIMVEFFNNKVDMISYRKIEENILGTADKLSDNETQMFLDVNSSGKIWKERDFISLNKEWQTEDADIFAHYDSIENILYIATKDCLSRKELEKKSKENENLKDF